MRCHSSQWSKHPSMWPWNTILGDPHTFLCWHHQHHCPLEDIQIKYGQKCMILSINVKHYVEIQNNENAQDWFSLEAKLCEGDVLVHIVLGLVHPRQLDLFWQNITFHPRQLDLFWQNVKTFRSSQFLYLLISEPKTLKLDLAILFIHWEPNSKLKAMS